MNYSMIRYTLGWLLLFEAAFFILPTLTGVIYGEWAAISFLISAVLTLILGLLLIARKPKNNDLYAKEGFVIVAMSWITMSIFGALPFIMTGATDSFVDALFETVSGFTTTGASIFSDVEALPKAVIMWRSFTHWIGGMGVLVFIMAFLPLSGGHNMHIMRAESPGPDVAKLVPKMRKTALILYAIYLVLTLIQLVALLIAGMDAFEAINTSFSTAGTGGFGFRNDSFASATTAQQVIVTVFMLIFSINFNSYYLILHKKFRDSFNSEIKVFLIIVAAAVVLISFDTLSLYDTVGDALKHAAFTVSSLISTTGFATADFNLWPELSRTILVLIMFVGACAGSTGGGIKVSRIIILFKGMARELRTLVHPRQVKKITIDKKAVSHELIRSVNAYIGCYILIFVISLIVVSFDTGDLVTNFTAVTATVNNVGPGLSAVGPTANYAFFSPLSKLVLTFDMLAGRLELFPMLILFSPMTYKKS